MVGGWQWRRTFWRPVDVVLEVLLWRSTLSEGRAHVQWTGDGCLDFRVSGCCKGGFNGGVSFGWLRSLDDTLNFTFKRAMSTLLPPYTGLQTSTNSIGLASSYQMTIEEILLERLAHICSSKTPRSSNHWRCSDVPLSTLQTNAVFYSNYHARQ